MDHLIREEEEEDRKLPAVTGNNGVRVEPEGPTKKKIKKEPPPSTSTTLNDCTSNNEDDVAVIIIPVATSFVAAAASRNGNNSNKEEAEVQFLHSTGPNPLSDFPHAREHCIVHPFVADPATHCINCYCYVCDTQVAKCTEWNEHCHATSTQLQWRLQRQAKKNPNSSQQQQQQQLQQQQRTYVVPYWSRPQYSVKQLLNAVTRVYPAETCPPADLFRTQLKHYQKQSLAFMHDVEQNYTIKSGWIASEVGMGKTAVVIALIVSNPMASHEHPTEEMVKNARFQKDTMVDVKGTIIFTSKSLLGQWEDEIQKHAPHLRTFRHHGNNKLKLADLAHADVILSVPTIEWSTVYQTSYNFYRVVVDESHLLGSVSARLSVVTSLATDRSWCITATPMISSVTDLSKQATFLGLENEFEQINNRKDFVERYMLRHTKSQMINGAAALSLPKATTKIQQVKMTQWERETFELNLNKSRQRVMYDYGMVQTKIVEMRWFAALMNPLTCEDSSKIVQLQKDLHMLLRKEPNMRAVVFTQLREQHRFICKAIKSMGLKTYRFDGSTSSEYRDRAIRAFQDVTTSNEPAVFVITMKAGSVGITLTAASHVFLMEPCIDPAQEIQAAGRIHRLGQTKQVGVTKYYFDDTCESQILKLHEKIQAGEITYTAGVLNHSAKEMLRIPRYRYFW